MSPRLKQDLLISMAIISLSLAAVITPYAETINYIYDELNRLKRIEYGDGTVVEYTYDNAGNRLAILDTIPPTGTITINSGATSTNSISVTLTLSCSDNLGCSQMQFSNDGTNYSAAEAYSTTKAWFLACGDGTKTVYVRFNDAAGNWSTPYSYSIVLDTGCANFPVKIGTKFFCTLQEGYSDNDTASESTIKSQAIRFTENLTINRNIAVTLEGGYDCDYTANTGNTTSIKGMITTTVGGGTITIRNFILEK